MEDASGVDLDWFWRGWFYGTDHVDIAIKNVELFKVDSKNPEVEKAFQKEMDAQKSKSIGEIRNEKGIPQTYNEKDPSINDFYATYDPFEVTLLDKKDYESFVKRLDQKDLELLNSKYNYYNITFENVGGLVMPLILNFTFKDGSSKEIRIPAEIWVENASQVSKIFFFEKEVSSIELDPWLETADVDLNNNNWPAKVQPTKFELFKQREYKWDSDAKENPMQRAKRNEKLEKGATQETQDKSIEEEDK
jgi:hypothetical protein